MLDHASIPLAVPLIHGVEVRNLLTLTRHASSYTTTSTTTTSTTTTSTHHHHQHAPPPPPPPRTSTHQHQYHYHHQHHHAPAITAASTCTSKHQQAPCTNKHQQHAPSTSKQACARSVAAPGAPGDAQAATNMWRFAPLWAEYCQSVLAIVLRIALAHSRSWTTLYSTGDRGWGSRETAEAHKRGDSFVFFVAHAQIAIVRTQMSDVCCIA
eukprot:CAMPEP_0181215572 /NCGR_PEP_ID=MMETSP1096-20121128/26087_1 /TAXON_ID=156174 ORGANISM="Chrysochromulina ericina, Strain CCMP281" /NCGR_SAMPLE_ID=MMETSP1096 /ASSEMBLY_ACC=CAM_ASM_000453 /LENGTH=210 /DNA_ID=CAMNT_0023307441 /DNA_START=222 /DNA_END=851 /DNA_ORIENTATION=+